MMSPIEKVIENLTHLRMSMDSFEWSNNIKIYDCVSDLEEIIEDLILIQKGKENK